MRGRALGLPFPGTPGPLNAITDVPGVSVGVVTLVADGPPVARTGVTVVLPRPRAAIGQALWAGRHSLNGNGEMTGAHWIDEAGQFLGPIAITNTHAIGAAHEGVIRWLIATLGRHPPRPMWLMPVVAETCDAHLNDMDALLVRPEHVAQAIAAASDGAVAEGNVGGGTGMICYEFKGGTGTASRVVSGHVIGVLVQANFGRRPTFSVLGVPVGQHLRDHRLHAEERGSIIVIVATDVPLQPIQLRRLAQRAGLGIARTGSYAGNGSGDLFLAFSTANAPAIEPRGSQAMEFLPHDALDPLFLATVEATEEAIVNAMLAARTMTGRAGHVVHALDHAALVEVMQRYGRM